MPTYVIYDTDSGDIVHVHREYYQGAPQTIEVDQERMMSELQGMLPKDKTLAVLVTEESLHPVRGQYYRVDPSTAQLMRLETPLSQPPARPAERKRRT
jgi:hypothetical protein